MVRKYLTPKQKEDVLKRQDGKCAITGVEILPGDETQADHIIPVALANEGKVRHIVTEIDPVTGVRKFVTDELIDVNDQRNMQIIFKDAHKDKTKQDVKDISKSRRIRGVTKTGPKQKIQSPGFQTNKNSAFKKPFNGNAVRRETNKTTPVLKNNQLCNATGKIIYPSNAAAMDAAHQVVKRKGKKQGKINAFKCDHCGGYHWGHRPRRLDRNKHQKAGVSE